MYKIILFLCILFSTTSYASYQVELGIKDVTIPSGWSSWTQELPEPIAVNPLRIVFWLMDKCVIIPISSISVKYKDIPYWSTTEYKDGAYYGDRDEAIVAFRVDLYQTKVESEVCIVKVSGYIR